MKTTNSKKLKRDRRHTKIRTRVFGTSAKPRLAVFRSNAFVYAQIIDDEAGKTLLAASDLKMKDGTKLARAEKVGETIAVAAKAKKIGTVVFDRGGFIYAGRVKAVADAARKGGLQF
ncbi:MAG: 50S ribosomal protein L18 [Candidatus Paceibacterota bacterium]|jgi:large subunit ribosomal protein L18